MAVKGPGGEVRPKDAIERFVFEGQALPVLRHHGRPVWPAKEVGRLLDYSGDGRRLVANIGEKWAGEFVEGVDFIKVEGEDLRDLKAALEVVPGFEGVVPGFVPSLMLLTESGFHLACVKTEQPIGVKLRRWLVDEVLPKLMRGESVSAAPATPVDTKLAIAQRREERLALAERRRNADFLVKVADSMAGLSDRARTALKAKAIEPMIGSEVVRAYLPRIDERWLTVTETAEVFGVSAQRAGGARKRAGVDGNVANVSEVRMSKSEHSAKQVPQTFVTPLGASMVGRQLVAEGHVSRDAYAQTCADHDLPVLELTPALTVIQASSEQGSRQIEIEEVRDGE